MSFPAEQSTSNLSSDLQPLIDESVNRGACFELARGPLSNLQQYYTKVSECHNGIIYIGEDARLAAIRAASIVFRNLLQKESRDSIFVQTGTIELLLPVLEGAHQFITEAQQNMNKICKELALACRDVATIQGLRSRLHFLEPRFAKASNDTTALEIKVAALESKNTALENKWRLHARDKIDAENCNGLLQIEIERLNKELKARMENSNGEEANMRDGGDKACSEREIYLSE